MKSALEIRKNLAQARRVIVKFGSRVLVQRTGRPDRRRLRALVAQIAALRAADMDVVVVSSGAIGSGMEALGMKRRPKSVPDLQMAAAVGQSRLMALYDELFAAHGLAIGQILLTHDDLKNRSRHLNARNTMMNLLRNGIVPIVNENDVVSTDEIKFGDNDLLAALTAMLIEADVLLLMTTVDGLREPSSTAGRTRRVAELHGVDTAALALAKGKGSELSTGGMASKLESAGMAVSSGIPVVIANGRATAMISRVMAGADAGTLIVPRIARDELPDRKKWIAFFHKPSGTLTVDEGARKAIEKAGRSLLPIGIKAVEGDFHQGAAVNIRALDGALIARGLTDYASEPLRRIMGRKTSEIAALLGSVDYEEVVHRDNMLIFSQAKA